MGTRLDISALLGVVANRILDAGIFSLDLKQTLGEFSLTLPSLYYYWDSQDHVKQDALHFYVVSESKKLLESITAWLQSEHHPNVTAISPSDSQEAPDSLATLFGRMVEAHLLLRGTPQFEETGQTISVVIGHISESSGGVSAEQDALAKLLEKSLREQWLRLEPSGINTEPNT